MSEEPKTFAEPYWVAPADDLPSHDFNRELLEPGRLETFWAGAVSIRVDDDFWAVAVLPWSYHEKSCEEIVREIWPSITKFRINPDSVAEAP